MPDLPDYPSYTPDATLQGPLNSHPPEPEHKQDNTLPATIKDPSFGPLTRHTTATASEGGSEKQDICRICRCEATADEPLFYPCKCSGSMRFVHQECLMEWLSHSHKKHCELCKTPFRFTKLYDAGMPQKLPWAVFVRRGLVHVGLSAVQGLRGLLVAIVWMVMLPWMIRWAWRWVFWVADAGWARDAFVRRLKGEDLVAQLGQANGTSSWGDVFQQTANPGHAEINGSTEPVALSISRDFFTGLATLFSGDFSASIPNATSSNPSSTSWPSPDASIFSHWTYISQLTPDPSLNRLILDIFEGQLITSLVIIAFILIFLIREWVVQQQPLVNLDQIGNVRQQLLENAQQQLREAADRVREENETLVRQQELLEQARQSLPDVSRDTFSTSAGIDEGTTLDFSGYEALEELLRRESDEEPERFLEGARSVMKQIRVAGAVGVDFDEAADRVYARMAGYPEEERRKWQEVVMGELESSKRGRKEGPEGTNEGQQGSTDGGQLDIVVGSSGTRAEEHMDSASASRRPEMPGRDFSSRATHSRRLLEEAEAGSVRASVAMQDSTDNVQTPAAEGSGTAPSSASSDSWQHVSPPNEKAEAVKNEPMPITNAGSDARINIRRSGKGKLTAVPEPKEEETPATETESKRRKSDTESGKAAAAEGTTDTGSTRPDAATASSAERQGGDHRDNPFHPDGPEPIEQDEDTLGNRVASAFREELGLDEADELEHLRQADLGPVGEDLPDDSNYQDNPQRLDEPHQRSSLQWLADWFWGDIHVQNAPEAVPIANEERVAGDPAQEVLFVPVQDGEPVPAHNQQPQPDPQPEAEAPQHDPEVLAAAQQAGLDAEAIEDAEDLEGILELVGLQGPLIGLFQTSIFCTALVSSTVFGAVGLPYVWGKFVLSFMVSPMYFLVQLPLQVASALADFLIDAVLFAGSLLVVSLGFLTNVVGLALQAVLPMKSVGALMEKLTAAAVGTASASGARLQSLFLITQSAGGLGWNWSLLGASVHSHASLRTLEKELDDVLDYSRTVLWSVLDTLSTASASLAWKRSLEMLSRVTDVPAKLLAAAKTLQQHAQPLMKALAGLKTGDMTFTVSSPQAPLDPSLVYWDPADRALAALTGYIALALLAVIYVAADTPITRTQSGQKTEKLVRDTLRQAGGVLKVILIISIEMLVFPLYCGMLIDIAFLPLFEGASMSTRLVFAAESPYLFCFIHWFLGTCYMFHFALFVGMCRKILRKGVLWFIRDPDDPTFHPVRDVLERNVMTQLRKIAFSALVYGALVILCLGGVIWSIGHVFEGIFPIHWVSTEPVLEFPVDLLLYNFLTPLVIRLFKPSDAVHAIYGWWFRHCARGLRLSHFLFDDRRKDEEGHFVRKTWWSFFLMRKANIEGANASGDRTSTEENETQEVHFERDGKYVLTPSNDQYRPPKPGEAFLHIDEDDVYITDQEGKKSDQFAKIFIPPHFTLRLTLFMVCLWIFSAFTGLCATLIPLAFGRQVFHYFLPQLRLNDIYAYSLGAYVLGALLFLGLKGGVGVRYVQAKTPAIDVKAWIEPARRYTLQVVKCVYVYGFLGLVLPTTFAVLLQFYLILPLHTYAVSLADAAKDNANTSFITNAADTALAILQQATMQQNASSTRTGPNLAHHSIHLLQDYALGILYVRIATKMVITTPTSRAAEAFRRVMADGYLNPDVRLATRFFVLPATLMAAFVLLFPLIAAWVATNAVQFAGYGTGISEETVTKVYRYSYPAGAVLGMALLSGLELGKATSRWRARIRDEVYLVGERLHNFGEKRPPVGSKSVVRKVS